CRRSIATCRCRRSFRRCSTASSTASSSSRTAARTRSATIPPSRSAWRSSRPAEEEVHARHILVATEDEAKAILAELKKGTAFDKLAKEKSTDKASGAEGGDLGWFKKSDMVKEFADAAFALKKGELTEAPIK